MVPLLVLVGGTIVGVKWGRQIYDWTKGKVQSVFHHAPSSPAPPSLSGGQASAAAAELSQFLDANMPADMKHEVSTLLVSVCNVPILNTAAKFYAAQNFPIAAHALAARAAKCAAAAQGA